MAPKGQLPAAKQAAVLKYIQLSQTVHSIKELEKALPSIASINGMQVKDYLQALQDENLLRVEKIGSGNWYWSFPSEAVKEKEIVLEKLQAELGDLEKSIAGMQTKLKDAEMSEEEQAQHQSLLATLNAKLEEVTPLEKELDSYRDGDPIELDKKRKQTIEFKDSAELWTENIYILEQKITELLGGDRVQLEDLKQEIYGGEYVKGEGLIEWN